MNQKLIKILIGATRRAGRRAGRRDNSEHARGMSTSQIFKSKK